MTDDGSTRAARPPRPSLSRTTFGVAAGAIAAAALIWSALFYEASSDGVDAHASAAATPAPVTTRTS